jgi:hypothetical protein
MARLASFEAENLNLLVDAEDRFLECQGNGNREVLPTRWTCPAPGVPAAKEALEQVAERRSTETAELISAQAVRRMTKPVVGSPAIGVGEYFVRFVDFLESLFGRRVAPVHVRVILPGELSIRLL